MTPRLPTFIAAFFRVSENRYQLIDWLRGLIFVNMFIYHFFLMANMYGVIDSSIPSGLFWRVYQHFIAGSFLFLVGISLHIVDASGIVVRKFLFRQGQLLACALCMTVGSFIFYPDEVITFGILHCILSCSVVAIFLLKLGLRRLFIPLGVVVLLLGEFYRSSMFNHPALNWTGLGTITRPAFDYIPMMPWFGMTLLGIGLAKPVLTLVKKIGVADNPILKGGAFAGQHTLFLYMVHAPFLLIMMELLQRV